MTIRRRTRDGVAIFDIQGKIVGEESLVLKRDLDAFVAERGGPTSLVLNIDGVPFLDSAGLGAIVLAHRQVTERNGRLAILSPVANVRRLLTVARLTDVIPVVDDEQSAVTVVREQPTSTHT